MKNNKLTGFTLILLGFIILPFSLATMMKLTGDTQLDTPVHGPPHNFWVPTELTETNAYWDSIEAIDPDMMYIRPTEEDILLLDTVLRQVEDIGKDLDTCFMRIKTIESKIDELIKNRNGK